MIEISDLHLSFNMESSHVDILRGVNLSVAAGSSVAVVGPSGSGKTSLLLLLAGLEKPTAGQVFWRGRPLAGLCEDDLADFRRDHLGIVFQSFHLVPSLNALENVTLPLEIAGRENATEHAMRMLERVGLSDRAMHYPAELSGGEQQRVAIARALIHQPELLLADEPTGNLDDETGALIVELLFDMQAEADATLILVTHDEAIAARCDRRMKMHNGLLEEATA